MVLEQVHSKVLVLVEHMEQELVHMVLVLHMVQELEHMEPVLELHMVQELEPHMVQVRHKLALEHSMLALVRSMGLACSTSGLQDGSLDAEAIVVSCSKDLARSKLALVHSMLAQERSKLALVHSSPCGGKGQRRQSRCSTRIQSLRIVRRKNYGTSGRSPKD